MADIKIPITAMSRQTITVYEDNDHETLISMSGTNPDWQVLFDRITTLEEMIKELLLLVKESKGKSDE